jgi:cell division septum initiation protein DivIVA
MTGEYPPEEHYYEEHPPSAADMVAQQIEGIIEAAQASAGQVASAAQAEADQIKSQARESAQAELEAARRGVVRMGEEARQEAAERIAEAQAAADEVLAEAKAVSSGLRQLGQLLTVHAERILRDVQNSHRAISADLRAAGSHSGRREEIDLDQRGERAEQPQRAGANPFSELDPPAWVEPGR